MPEQPLEATDVARELAQRLNDMGQEYALGGAIALGYWAEPRGTVDVDLFRGSRSGMTSSMRSLL